jgi:hypothetical protein
MGTSSVPDQEFNRRSQLSARGRACALFLDGKGPSDSAFLISRDRHSPYGRDHQARGSFSMARRANSAPAYPSFKEADGASRALSLLSPRGSIDFESIQRDNSRRSARLVGRVQREEPTVLQICLLVNGKEVDDAAPKPRRSLKVAGSRPA